MSSALVSLLEHSSVCNEDPDRCHYGSECREMKQLINHLLLCKLINCKVCLEVNEYVQAHAAGCSVSVCPVMTCNAWRQYTASSTKSTLSSYSSDCQALDSLRTKSKSQKGLQPKVRGTYLCGKCRMPKIRPHKCGEDPSSRYKTGLRQSSDEDQKSEESRSSMHMSLCAPSFCEEEPAHAVFTFQSRRSQQSRSMISRSHSSDVEVTKSQSLSSATLIHSRSMDTFDLSRRTEAPQQPRPPLSPAGSAPSPMMSRSLDSPLQLVQARRSEQVISLVKKSNSYGFDCIPSTSARSIAPSSSSASSSASAVPISYTQNAFEEDSVDSTTTSTSASSVRKRLLSPKSSESNRRVDGSKPRLASLPVSPSESFLSQHYHDVGNEPTLPQFSGESDATGEFSETAMPEDINRHKDTYNTASTPSTSSSEATHSTSATHTQTHSTSASDLSEESSVSDECEYFDERDAMIPSLINRTSQPMLNYSAANYRLPPAFPMLSDSSFPINSNTMIFYQTADPSGRLVLMPCWAPPSQCKPDSFLPTDPHLLTKKGMRKKNDLGAEFKSDKIRSKSRKSREKRSESDRTAVCAENVVSPAHDNGACKKQQQKRKYTKKVSNAALETAVSNHPTSATSARLDTLNTLDTLLSSDLDAELTAELGVDMNYEDDLNMGLDAFTLALDEMSMPDQLCCDEDEEDIFKYLADEIIL